MGLQVFGTRKCPETRKAERWLKERRVAYQFIDLSEKGPSKGELESLSKALGLEALLDAEGKRYRDRGLAHFELDLAEAFLEDPLLLRTPILRDGRKAALGFDPQTWEKVGLVQAAKT